MNSNQGVVECPPVPETAPFPHEVSTSLCVSVVEGSTLNLWSIATPTAAKTESELKLQLQPDQSVVIGRQEGGQIEYLDPRYQPTQMLPNSLRRVVTSVGHGIDLAVSRGHFMLKGSIHGILLLNGVPRRGGGIRPPMNGTAMLEPNYRTMDEGEEYLIARGAATTIGLPNGTVILLRAE